MSVRDPTSRRRSSRDKLAQLMFNALGYGHEGVLEKSSIDDLQRQFSANVFGSVAMVKAVLPGMRERRRGHIINVTSMAASLPCRESASTAAASSP